MRLDEFIQNTRYRLMVEGKEIDSEYWQGSEPLDTMVELMHVSKIIEMSDDVEDIQKQTNARMPWADLHFEERVGGEPLNPPPSFFALRTRSKSNPLSPLYPPGIIPENLILFSVIRGFSIQRLIIELASLIVLRVKMSLGTIISPSIALILLLSVFITILTLNS